MSEIRTGLPYVKQQISLLKKSGASDVRKIEKIRALLDDGDNPKLLQTLQSAFAKREIQSIKDLNDLIAREFANSPELSLEKPFSIGYTIFKSYLLDLDLEPDLTEKADKELLREDSDYHKLLTLLVTTMNLKKSEYSERVQTLLDKKAAKEELADDFKQKFESELYELKASRQPKEFDKFMKVVLKLFGGEETEATREVGSVLLDRREKNSPYRRLSQKIIRYFNSNHRKLDMRARTQISNLLLNLADLRSPVKDSGSLTFDMVKLQFEELQKA